jgi:hypothetical protein
MNKNLMVAFLLVVAFVTSAIIITNRINNLRTKKEQVVLMPIERNMIVECSQERNYKIAYPPVVTWYYWEGVEEDDKSQKVIDPKIKSVLEPLFDDDVDQVCFNRDWIE